MYNVEQYVAQCLESCIHQVDFDQSAYEIIIVNDGSTDNSLTIAAKYRNEYPSLIKILDQKNTGLSGARNNGVSIASGDFVWFIDSDDWISEKSLSILVPYLKEENDMIPIGGVHVKESGMHDRKKPFSEIRKMSGIDAFLNKAEIKQAAPYCIFRKEFLKMNNLKFVEGILHEDLEFCPRATYLAKTLTYLPYPLYFNRLTQRISITSVAKPKRSLDLLYVIKSLELFRQEYVMNKSVSKRFFINESIAINNALSNIIKCSKDDQAIFVNEYNKELAFYNGILLNSPVKYKLEGLLFFVFAHSIIRVYKLLQIFNN